MSPEFADCFDKFGSIYAKIVPVVPIVIGIGLASAGLSALTVPGALWRCSVLVIIGSAIAASGFYWRSRVQTWSRANIRQIGVAATIAGFATMILMTVL